MNLTIARIEYWSADLPQLHHGAGGSRQRSSDLKALITFLVLTPHSWVCVPGI